MNRCTKELYLFANISQGIQVAPAELEAHLLTHPAVDVIPKSASGKILRKLLREKDREARRQKGARL